MINKLIGNKKISLVSKEMMEVIYNKNFLKGFNYINYYGINNRYIIEFNINNEINSLLILNTFNNNIKLGDNIFIIIYDENNHENKSQLFFQLLNLNNNQIINESRKKNIFSNLSSLFHLKIILIIISIIKMN